MVDCELVLAKAASVKRHLGRVNLKGKVDLQTFLGDIDCQEVIFFNLQMAIQNCIDMASHVISDEGLGMPGSTNEMFYMLQENGYVSRELAEKMVAAVGFRNLVVHEYAKLDLEEVYKISRDHTDDLLEFLKALFKRAGLEPSKKSV
jgi:uncharacterized protein YutE (UPF0331/DUF86 family)